MTAMAEFRVSGLRLLWWAVWVEFLLARLLSRVGIYIPKTGTALQTYQVVLSVGEMAFTFSLLLAVVLLAAMLWRQRPGVAAPAGAAALLVLLVPGSAAPAGWSLAAALAAAGAVAALGAGAMRSAASRWERGALAAVLAVHLLGYLAAAGQLAWSLWNLPGELPFAGALLRAGELLALAAPLALAPGAVRLRGGARVWAWAAGIGAALALGAATLLSGDITAILAMYALGFSLSWPTALYVAAVALGLPGLLALLRTNPTRGLVLGLLFLAGYALHVNQQHLIVLVCWAALALPARTEVTASA